MDDASKTRPAFLGRGRGRGSGSVSAQQKYKRPVVGHHPTNSLKSTDGANGGGFPGSTPSDGDRFVEEEIEEEQEEQDEVEGIVQKLLHSYHKESSVVSTDDGAKEGFYGAMKQRMNEAVLSSTGSCMICYCVVKRVDPIWSCLQCYCAFHLNCIQSWSRESTSVQLKSRTAQLFPDRPINWTCPKCRFEYSMKSIPQQYICYCGKKVNPPNDPWLAPHSCGDVCSKHLSCGHKCSLLCHPGACPECPKTVATKCYCGRRGPVARRCGFKGWSCGGMCRKVLSCELHICEEQCHDGSCPPCTYGVETKCLCGKESVLKPCGTSEWRCQNICGRNLSCGHSCDKVCHSGECGECTKAANISCPCGKLKYPDLLCTDEPPVCGDTCGKKLACGEHVCMQRCHNGPCGTCRILCSKKCRCGKHEKTVPCSTEYLCENKCSNLRNCGRHQCKRKCCDGQCLSCEQVCNKKLPCRKHKCAAPCHAGPCYPCALTEAVACACGAAKVTVPCGCERETKPPSCKEPCRKPPTCHHKERKPHRCHFGPCPKCRRTCNRELDCGHLCRCLCHSEPITTVKHQPMDPLAPLSKRPPPVEEVTVQPCPPCTHLVTVNCFGGHESTKMKCSEARGYSCSRSCGRDLTCGNHTCQRECHSVINSTSDHEAGEGCDVCEEVCCKPRPPGCTHSCPLPCHQGPCPKCVIHLRFRCHCDLYSVVVKCSEWNEADPEKQKELLTCSGTCPKQLPCGHRCPLTCHSGVCDAVCRRNVTIRCSCKRLKKEARCYDAKNTQVNCDSECKRLLKEKRAREIEEEQKKEEEQRRRKEEEEESHQRMLQGRRKKRKKKEQVEEEEECTSWFTLRRVSFIVTCILCVVLFYFLVAIVIF